jgi:ABC-type iron transport system FetAB ATPase subunit
VGAHFSEDEKRFIQQHREALRLPDKLFAAEVMTLSSGERQRLALLRSLAKMPHVLLLDEPTAALDANTTLAVESLLKTYLEKGLSIFFVTHSEEQAKRIGHRVVRVHNRRFVDL